jgi:hypothetical protein
MIEVRLTNGDDGHVSAFVNSYRALRVANVVPELQPMGSLNRKRIHTELISGLNVDGSSTPQIFKVEADNSENYDIYFTRLIITISDGKVSHSKYGAINKLSNGTDIFIVEGGRKTYLVQGATTGGELIVKSGMFSPYGDGATVCEVSSWSLNDDAQVIVMDLSAIISEGLRLGRGTFDYIGVQINDDLTALTDHFIQLIGYRLYE